MGLISHIELTWQWIDGWFKWFKVNCFFFCIFELIQLAGASGFFELEIVELQNPSGRLASGNCCGSVGSVGSVGSDDDVDVEKEEEEVLDVSGDVCDVRECRTMFRLCLKEYQSNVTVSSPCTYGHEKSRVLGGNSFTFVEPDRSHARLVLPFTFRWTVSPSRTFFLYFFRIFFRVFIIFLYFFYVFLSIFFLFIFLFFLLFWLILLVN